MIYVWTCKWYWCPPSKIKIVTSDLVYSPAQVTEHHWVELKDQDVSQKMKDMFEELKQKYPKVFSINNEDIGHTALVTMGYYTGDSLQCVKKCTPYPTNIRVGFNKKFETLEQAGVIKNSISPWASPIVVVWKKSAPGEPPHRRMCIDFRTLNELQPEVQCADSETGLNISLVPLPKLMECMAY